MVRGVFQFILILILVEIATSALNYTLDDWENELMGYKAKKQDPIKSWRRHVVKTRRQGAKRYQSTSSSETRGTDDCRHIWNYIPVHTKVVWKKSLYAIRPPIVHYLIYGSKVGSSDESLQEKFTGSSSPDSDEPKRESKTKDRAPKSTVERKGWRKWHRKCTPCPEDIQKRWRDPSIKWICGAYQRARRTFKSLCMMHYRNCQDGTMFTKIADHRCPNGSGQVRPYNEHFFYDYKVVLTEDSTESGEEETPDEVSSSSSWSASRIRNLPPLPPQN